MICNKKQAIIGYILDFVQILVFILPVILEYYSREKMGVIRYLVFKNQGFQKTIFTLQLISLYKCILFSSFILCTILLIYNYNKIRYIGLTKTIISAIVFNLVGIVFMLNKHIELLNSYYFFLISIFTIIILQYIKLLINYLLKKQN